MNHLVRIALLAIVLVAFAALLGIPDAPDQPAVETRTTVVPKVERSPRKRTPNRAPVAAVRTWLVRFLDADDRLTGRVADSILLEPSLAWRTDHAEDLAAGLKALAPFFKDLDSLLRDPVTGPALGRGAPFLPPAFGSSANREAEVGCPDLERASTWVALACGRAVSLSRSPVTVRDAPEALAQAFDLSALLDDGSAVAYANRCELDSICLEALATMHGEREVSARLLRQVLDPRLRRASSIQRLRLGFEYEQAAWFAALRGDDAYLERQAAGRERLGFKTQPQAQLTQTFLARRDMIVSSLDGVCTLWPTSARAAPAEPLVHLARTGHWNRERLTLARLALALSELAERRGVWPKQLREVDALFPGLLPTPDCIHGEVRYSRAGAGAVLEWRDLRDSAETPPLRWTWDS